MSSKNIKYKKIAITSLVIIILVIILAIIVKGVINVLNYSSNDLNFKDVTSLEYNNYTLADFLKENITCKENTCTYKKVNIEYTISEVTSLGNQDLNVSIKYKDKEYQKTYNVEIVDKKAPEIKLKERIVYLDKNASFKPEEYIESVSDNFDTLTNEQVEIENNLDSKTSGEYEVIYKLKDNSNNETEAKLKVIVRGNTSSSNEPKPSTSNINIESDFSWKLETSGIVNISRVINNDNQKDNFSKDLKESWVTNLTIKNNFQAKYNVELEYIVTKDNQEFKKGKTTITKNNYDFNLDLTDAGTYNIKIKVKDMYTYKVYEENLTLKVIKPEHLEDIKLTVEYKNNKAYLDVLAIGGKEEDFELSQFVITVDGNPVLTEEELANIIDVDENEDYLVLKYEPGKEYYVIIGVKEGSIEKIASITIKK